MDDLIRTLAPAGPALEPVPASRGQVLLPTVVAGLAIALLIVLAGGLSRVEPSATRGAADTDLEPTSGAIVSFDSLVRTAQDRGDAVGPAGDSRGALASGARTGGVRRIAGGAGTELARPGGTGGDGGGGGGGDGAPVVSPPASGGSGPGAGGNVGGGVGVSVGNGVGGGGGRPEAIGPPPIELPPVVPAASPVDVGVAVGPVGIGAGVGGGGIGAQAEVGPVGVRADVELPLLGSLLGG